MRYLHAIRREAIPKELPHLRGFATMAPTGNFARAAAAGPVSPPSLRQQIYQAEKTRWGTTVRTPASPDRSLRSLHPMTRFRQSGLANRRGVQSIRRIILA